jgi:hypothetical protein
MANYIKLFEQWLMEGGWATTKTQSTLIKPKIIADGVKKLQIIGKEFADHCKGLELPALDFSKPIGSGTWYEDDIVSQPDKVYGDIDFMVSYPTLELGGKDERANEIATVKLYNNEMLSFLKSKSYAFIDYDETAAVSEPSSLKLIMQVETPEGEGWIQVDMVVTHSGYKEWAIFRMTPIRNVKGFVLGNLYSAFGEVLELSIQPRGVRAKFAGTAMASYSKRAGVEDRLVTANISTFMHDIAKFFWEQSGTNKPYAESASLSSWKGINPADPKFEDLCDGIVAVAQTLEQLGEFGTVIKYNSAKALLDAVKARYIEKMETAANSSKFDKITTPAAQVAADKVKTLVADYTSKIKQLLNENYSFNDVHGDDRLLAGTRHAVLQSSD